MNLRYCLYRDWCRAHVFRRCGPLNLGLALSLFLLILILLFWTVFEPILFPFYSTLFMINAGLVILFHG